MMVSRLYLLWRAFEAIATWNDRKFRRVCEIFDARNISAFAIKSKLREHPAIIFTISGVILLFTMGYTIVILERPYDYFSNQNFGYVANGIWCAFVTITTVGYGDFIPGTYMGRTICTIGVIFGQFLISIMVNGLNNMI